MTQTPLLEIRVIDDADDGGVTVDLSGNVVAATTATLSAAARFVLFSPKVVLDLTNVVVIDPAGATALEGMVRSIQDSGSRVALVSSHAGVEDVLHLSGLDGRVTLAGSADAARSTLVGMAAIRITA